MPSPPTLDKVVDELLENADFEEVESVSKARAYVSWANRYFILSPQSQSDGASSLAINAEQIDADRKRAREFIREQTGASGSVRFLTTSSGFRR